jgi:hypothetical protein
MLGAGCDGRGGVHETKRTDADGEVVWSYPPDAGDKLCETFREATVATKPGSPRRACISRKTIAHEEWLHKNPLKINAM